MRRRAEFYSSAGIKHYNRRSWITWRPFRVNDWQTPIRGISLRQVRLVSGMVLFAYLISHFLNHALGNISMEALARGVYVHTAFWQFLPVTIVFYTACLVHPGLGSGRCTSAANSAGRRSSRCSFCLA